MAYLDLGLADSVGAAVPASSVDFAGNALSRPERDAVLYSLGAARTALGLGRIARPLGRFWLGSGEEPVFAGERLEAIRRYAVRYRLEGAGLALEEEERLATAGVTPLEAAEVRALVDRQSASAAPRRRLRHAPRQALAWLLVASLPAAIGTLLYYWLAAQVEDRLSALVVAIVFTMGVVSPVVVAGHPTGRRA